MQSHQKEIVKDITSGFQLESELQISQAQHGVAVLDVYNAEWGNAKAINEAFRRLHTDAGDLVHLRFFSVECNAVLESLKAPQEAKAVQRPKTAINYEADTSPTFWSPILESRCQHSKPYFVFYKEGKMRDTIEGIDTPKICKYIQDLCKQQNPITEYITNADLLRFWQKYFSPYESEVNWSSFVSALKKEGYPADDATMSTLATATSADAKVDVANIQTWLGESVTLQEKLAEVQGSTAARELPTEEKLPDVKEAEAPKDADEWRELDDETNPEAPVEEKQEEGAEEEKPAEEAPAEEATPAEEPREIQEESEKTQEEVPPPPAAEEAPQEAKETEEPKDADEWRELDDEEQQAEAPADEGAEGELPAEEGPVEAHRELQEEPITAEELVPPETEEPKNADEWRELDDENNAEAPAEECAEEEAPTEEEPPAEEGSAEAHHELQEEPETVEEEVKEPKDADEWRELDDEEQQAEAPAEEGAEEEAPAEERSVEAHRELQEEPETAEEVVPPEAEEPKDADEWRELDDENNAEAPVEECAEEEAPAEEEPPAEEGSAEAHHVLQEEETEEPKDADEWRELDDEEQQEEALAEEKQEVTTEKAAEGNAPSDDEYRESGEAEHTIKRTEYVTETKEINQIYVDGWVTVSEEEMQVWNGISDVPLHYPVRTAAMLRPRDQVPDVEVPSPETLDTLEQYMEKQGVPPASINMVCLAADQKIGSESLSYGKAALVLINGDAENIKGLFPNLGSLHSDLSEGMLLQKDAPVAFTTICLCASQVYADEAFYYTLNEDERAQFAAYAADQELVLSALTPLLSKRPDDDSLKVRIAGIPKVIELASTDEGEETVVLSQWHAVLKVTENSDDVLSLQFVEYVSGDAFQEFVTAYTERLTQDENRIERKKGTEEDDAEGEEVIDENADEM